MAYQFVDILFPVGSSSFPSVTWIDLGNNVDIFSLPQPFLVSLRKRCPKQGNLPTILEFGESQASDPPERLRGLEEEEETDDTNRTESMGDLRSRWRRSWMAR